MNVASVKMEMFWFNLLSHTNELKFTIQKLLISKTGLRINAATCNPFGKDAVKFWAGQDYKPITEGGKSSRRELHKAYPLIGQNRKPPPSDVDWYYGVKA